MFGACRARIRWWRGGGTHVTSGVYSPIQRLDRLRKTTLCEGPGRDVPGRIAVRLEERPIILRMKSIRR